MSKDIQIIAFDADDTLWNNEIYYQETEHAFCELLKDYLPAEEVSKVLFETEMRNLDRYGFGAKSFLLSLLETGAQITGAQMTDVLMHRILGLGHELIDKPITLLDGVEETLDQLNGNYKLVLATKGDLLDQERKLKNSSLSKYFDHVEVMSDKQILDYGNLVSKLSCQPQEFMMVGNSVKSDIIPVLELGGSALHVPFHVTWAHEVVEEELVYENYRQLKNIREVVDYLKS
ncbi:MULTISPECIES: HAD family hydrolase [Myroides]|uniref:HAD family hydrolase n=1 Tax=Myroides TaxID=76831 RepID=UPI00057D4806|nr:MULTISPECIES: HAD family hydrolase [Myroides]AJA70512.1 putative hydrolase (HAD superfamily) [Myroides sp. A21]APA93734.1 HAD family hydrolase [Myroides sp. ZB35]MCS7474723.1 HAD family hydrolase [Myroides odoratimimus]MDM1397992.1 HAD family hydrolase [Myroides odoratimimus]MDM1513251.1 HAD family hydrolase [Myroides odoratimimus]